MHTERLIEAIRAAVRERYGSLARKDDEAGQETISCCSPAPAKAGAYCGGTVTTDDYSTALGYLVDDQASVPAGSNLGLGCGNPIAAARCNPVMSFLIWEVEPVLTAYRGKLSGLFRRSHLFGAMASHNGP